MYKVEVTYEDMRKVKKALEELGFTEKQGYFRHKECPWFVEFVSPPVAIGNEPVTQFNNIKTPLGTIKTLHPVDSVKDRLASFFHWDDKQGLEQALSICLEQPIDFKEITRWSTQEGHEKKLKIFLKRAHELNLI